MNLNYGIRNFRVFDKNGTRFNIKPITILTGANCAGKSTLVKSILLLKSFIDKARLSGSSPERIALPFSDGDININGIKAVYNHNSNGCNEVVFSLSKAFLSDKEEIMAEFFFSDKKGDFFNDGWLKRMRFSCVLNTVSEVFLDIVYKEDGSMSIDTLNLSGNIFQLFCRNLDLASYDKLFEDECSSIYSGFFNKTPEEVNQLSSQIDELTDSIRKNPLNDAVDLEYQAWNYAHDSIKTSSFEKPREIARFKNLEVNGVDYPCWKTFKESGILMYLSILEDIGHYSPAELEKMFDGLTIQDNLLDPYQLQYSDYVYNGIDYRSVFKRVVELFKESGCKTFIDFYKGLQESALQDVGMITPHELKDYPAGATTKTWRQAFLDSRFGYSNDVSGFADKISAVISMLTHLHYLEYQEYPDYPDTLLYRAPADYYLTYRVLTYLEREKCQTGNIKFWTDSDTPYYQHKDNNRVQWRDPNWDGLADVPESLVFVRYRSFLLNVFKSLIGCEEFAHVRSVGSFLCPVLRTYSIFEKNPMSDVLKAFISGKNRIAADKSLKYKPGSFINKWMKSLGVGNQVAIELNDDATGLHIFIVDEKGNRLSSADYGHGVTQLLFVLINIEVEIIEALLDRKYTRTLCLEEPEVSLHPSWQSKLAYIFRDAQSAYGIHFIIETHSEYLTRATQAMVATECKTETSLKSFPCVVYYMEQDGTAYDLEYTLSGRFKNSFGPGFYDEASRSSILILQREKQMHES